MPAAPSSLPFPTQAHWQRWQGEYDRLHAQMLAEGTTFFRALHTTRTGIFALDQAGDVGILSLYQPLSEAQELELCERSQQLAGLSAVYLKRRPPEARHLANTQREYLSPPLPLVGTPQSEVSVTEQGLNFIIRPGSDLSIGLFNDARPARAWVRAHASGRRVLNTFAYTCGFGVAAGLGEAGMSGAGMGGASSTTNLDLSRKVLVWGKEHYALNGLNTDAGGVHDFIYGDVFDWLGRLAKRGERYDLVVLDPPSFARNGKQVWRSERDYPQLVQAALAVLSPGGQLLALCNHAGLSAAQFDGLLRKGMLGKGMGAVSHTLQAGPAAGIDYPQAQHLKARIVTLEQ